MQAQVSAERIVEVNTAAWEFWRWHARQPGEWTAEYLAGRGLRGVRAGYAPPGWARLVPTLHRKHVTDDELLAAGLAVRTAKGALGDAFRDRLVLPITDTADRIIGFTARRNPAVDGDESVPKYLNTTTTAVYDKHRALYGLDQAAARRITAGAAPVLVEGALDVEAVRRAGPDYVPVAACGTAITTGHLEQLRTLDPHALERAIVTLDGDAAGAAGARRLWDQLTATEAGTIGAVVLPAGTDPAGLLEAGHRDELAALLAHPQPLTHAVIDQALAQHGDHLEGRLAAVRDAAQLVRCLEPYAAAAAGLHLSQRVTDTLDTASVLAEILDAYRSAEARQA
ncbi:toprim domain-containing protein [Puerhibacterium puerhi]|uniref:toprim domain-containing protein n=1 Tax=Puerhibacterium puerhi TaxID=2692623 RepID=UPI001F3A0DBC|nr:toprim domain-containing protein [Puerhibacterium puerhi]